MKILIVLTSHDRLGNTGNWTGYSLQEFAAPYYFFKDAGAAVTLASPRGGMPPVDPGCDGPRAQTDVVGRLKADTEAQAGLAASAQLRSISAEDFDAVFFPGGHGALWDLASFTPSIKLIQDMLEAGKPVAAVGHAVGVLQNVRNPEGRLYIEGRSVTGFSNTEEAATGLSRVIPFLVEDMLTTAGGKYTKAADQQPHVVADGILITGQNSASAEAAAKMLTEKLSFFSGENFVKSIPWKAV